MSDLQYLPLDVDDPEHMQAACDISRECELATVGWTDTTLEQMIANLGGPIAWREAQLIVRDGDEAVGLLAMENESQGREVFIDGYAVGPRRAEILNRLLDLGLERARELAAGDPEAAARPGADLLELDASFWQATSAAYSADREYVEAILGHGFIPIRTYWRMVLELEGWTADEPPAPAGVTRRVVDGEADQRILHRLRNESFAEHHGETYERTFEDYIERLAVTEGCDPSRWWIAELDGEPVGLCILDDSKAEFNEGYVRTLGVVKSARGRGVARWLLQCSAADAVSRGHVGLALTVDGHNTTGATRLYESVGFRTRQQIDVYCLPLVDSAQSR